MPVNAKQNNLKSYLSDPFLAGLMIDIMHAGKIKSVLVDITNKCNLRCEGCYYYLEGMDSAAKVKDEDEFDNFIEREKARSTNMITVLGGEPALELDRVRKLAKYFHTTMVTNGTLEIPYDGLEDVHLAVSFWGNEEDDIRLRGNGKRNIFDKALEFFKDDPRVAWYYTIVPGRTAGVRDATKKMVNNGNYVSYSFYGDLSNKGGGYSHKNSFEKSIKIINQMIDLYPEYIVSSPHINDVIARQELFGQKWGYDVCPNLTFDHPDNLGRIKAGKLYGNHFRAYNADLKTTRRCCVGNARNCDTCTDLWAYYGWVVSSMKEHLKTKNDFIKWICTTYLFYLSAGVIPNLDVKNKIKQINQRLIFCMENNKLDPDSSI